MKILNKCIVLMIFCILSVVFCANCPIFAERLPVQTDIFVPDARQEVKLPILMYHSVLNSKTGKYIVSPAQLESDIQTLQKAGYTFVFPSQVIAYVKGIRSLPEKPAMITFDDGHYNNLYYAEPILKKYNAKALISVIGKFSEYSTESGDHSNPNYSHVTWKQIREMSDGGCFEIGNHSYNLHNYKPRFGIGKKSGENSENYCNCIKKDINKLQILLKNNCEIVPKVFAYPFGEYCLDAENTLIDMGFEMMLTCNEGVSTIKKGDEKSLYKLKRINRNGSYTSSSVLQKISEKI